MNKNKKKKLEDKGYKVDNYIKFLKLTSEEEDRIMVMVNEARLKWEEEK